MDALLEVNWALIAPLIILQVILMIFALFNLARQDETKGAKWMWALIIIFINIIGPVIYFLIGRKNE